MSLKPREAIKPFTDIPKLSFGYEVVISILSRLPDIKEMSNMIYLYLYLISLFLLTLLWTQFFLFTGVEFPPQNSPGRDFSYQNVFWVELLW